MDAFSPLGAARAYQNARKLEIAPAAPIDQVERPSFAQVLESTARQSVDTIRAGEAAAIKGLQGQMPMQQVVEATMAMESALKVTVALRDKVVEAYQDVIRMSV